MDRPIEIKQNEAAAEGVDFYYNEQGLMVLTAKFHLERGYCCGNGCKTLPFNYERVSEPAAQSSSHNKEEMATAKKRRSKSRNKRPARPPGRRDAHAQSGAPHRS